MLPRRGDAGIVGLRQGAATKAAAKRAGIASRNQPNRTLVVHLLISKFFSKVFLQFVDKLIIPLNFKLRGCSISDRLNVLRLARGCEGPVRNLHIEPLVMVFNCGT